MDLFTPRTGESRRLFAEHSDDDLSSHALRQAIGGLGFFLPILLWLVARWRSVAGFPGWYLLDSISEYYHSGAGAILTGVLAALAVFLFTYQGYADTAGRTWDRRVGKVVCVAALGVSLFPTEAIPPFVSPPWWSAWMDTVHFASATILFVSFIIYSYFLFPMKGPNPSERARDKNRRNLIYRACGIGMFACVTWAGVAHFLKGPIFWPETLALWLFAVSWLTKGKADFTLAAVGKMLWARVRRPPPKTRQLA